MSDMEHAICYLDPIMVAAQTAAFTMHARIVFYMVVFI